MSDLQVIQNNRSEQEIIALLVRRDIGGIQELYSQYGNAIYGVIIRIVKVEYFAEIVSQNTFLKIWNNIGTYNVEKSKLFTWIINIARHAAIDMIRSKNYKQSMAMTNLDSVRQSEYNSSIISDLENMDLKSNVYKLDEKYRTLIDFAYFKGYTMVEISQELNIPLGTVKTRIRKAFKDLRVLMANG